MQSTLDTLLLPIHARATSCIGICSSSTNPVLSIFRIRRLTNLLDLCRASFETRRICLRHLDKKNADEADRHEEEVMKIGRGVRMPGSGGRRSEEKMLIAGMGSKNKGCGEATKITTDHDHGHHVAKIALLRRLPQLRKQDRGRRRRRRRKRPWQ